MRIRICEADYHLTNCHTRIPFRFGVHTMTAAPLCLARVLVETPNGRRAEGFSCDLLVPKWFEKNPHQTIEQDWGNLLSGARAAADLVLGCTKHQTVFEHWWTAYDERVLSDRSTPISLLRGHGVALLERAMMDGACRLASIGFFEALKTDLFGFRPGAIDTKLAGWTLAKSLPDRPTPLVSVRHTVGLVDALRRVDIPLKQRVNDGLPESLEEDIRHYGVTFFKLKLSGEPEQDFERLRRVANVLRAEVGDRCRVTIDGNEQFENPGDLVVLLERLAGDPAGRTILDALLYIEQPLPRDMTFDPSAGAALRELNRIAPCIIDEGDYDTTAFTRAIELGYRGVSIKNCKGVFGALVNFGRCRLADGGLFQSAEDLTNLPVISLQQDLATISSLGLTHAERNGHHYFNGLGHLPQEEQQVAVAHHGDLYQATASGPQLRIEQGRLSTDSLHGCPGYAYDVPVNVNSRTPLEAWSAEGLRQA